MSIVSGLGAAIQGGYQGYAFGEDIKDTRRRRERQDRLDEISEEQRGIDNARSDLRDSILREDQDYLRSQRALAEEDRLWRRRVAEEAYRLTQEGMGFGEAMEAAESANPRPGAAVPNVTGAPAPRGAPRRSGAKKGAETSDRDTIAPRQPPGPGAVMIEAAGGGSMSSSSRPSETGEGQIGADALDPPRTRVRPGGVPRGAIPSPRTQSEAPVLAPPGAPGTAPVPPATAQDAPPSRPPAGPAAEVAANLFNVAPQVAPPASPLVAPATNDAIPQASPAAPAPDLSPASLRDVAGRLVLPPEAPRAAPAPRGIRRPQARALQAEPYIAGGIQEDPLLAGVIPASLGQRQDAAARAQEAVAPPRLQAPARPDLSDASVRDSAGRVVMPPQMRPTPEIPVERMAQPQPGGLAAPAPNADAPPAAQDPGEPAPLPETPSGQILEQAIKENPPKTARGAPRRETPEQAGNRAVRSFMDGFREYGAPYIVEQYVSRGLYDEAQQFQTWIDEQEVQAGMETYARAALAASQGDLDTFGQLAADLYGNESYFGDGLTVDTAASEWITDPETGDRVGARMVFRNDEGEMIVQTWEGMEDFAADVLTMLAPERAFEATLEAAKRAQEIAQERVGEAKADDEAFRERVSKAREAMLENDLSGTFAQLPPEEQVARAMQTVLEEDRLIEESRGGQSAPAAAPAANMKF